MQSSNKIISHNVVYVTRPKIILSDSSTQFAPPRQQNIYHIEYRYPILYGKTSERKSIRKRHA